MASPRGERQSHPYRGSRLKGAKHSEAGDKPTGSPAKPIESIFDDPIKTFDTTITTAGGSPTRYPQEYKDILDDDGGITTFVSDVPDNLRPTISHALNAKYGLTPKDPDDSDPSSSYSDDVFEYYHQTTPLWGNYDEPKKAPKDPNANNANSGVDP